LKVDSILEKDFNLTIELPRAAFGSNPRYRYKAHNIKYVVVQVVFTVCMAE